MDAETAARQYLTNALASEPLPTFTAGDPGAEKSEFKLITVEAVPLTGTQMVKFCQYYRRIPVYGSLVAVELDKKNELISINSTLTEPTNVDAVASVAPADVLQTVVRASGADPQISGSDTECLLLLRSGSATVAPGLHHARCSQYERLAGRGSSDRRCL